MSDENKTTSKSVSITPRFAVREITLTRCGVKVTLPEDWTVEDSMKAQRYGKGDPTKTTLALMQAVCRFDGEKWTITDMMEKISGKDFIELQGAFYSDADEDEEKN